ncbi:mitotic checkpoint serine/threonine-protein kinase BUB1 beta-like [Sitophilus oryzae]|uniref:Mitotic checkpoint serine/threonine-protein kinase BUB1 beta-like n=1 Tax=Sitophilus oryzae TaxID=7048 RepID=A0A6J2XQI5_SITOR|nr:mitotic checkpoint serine/threonine-protein kinase BUB1 beta-like [Sitophilus oryzae]
MEFDYSKENIQPLRRGRNAQQLEMALQAQTNQEYQMQLLQQKEEYEQLISNYEGNDPLENYYNYIIWIEESYPKSGHEGNCIALLEHCLGIFENDTRYTNDRRFCKLWIKYIDMFPNPLELYLMMKSKNLCTGCADFYKAWAYYYEAVGDFQKANNVFEEGKKNLAQPYEDLEIAHKNLITAAGEHVLFGRNENRLQEKRQALISLHSHPSGRVNNVRVPSGTNNGISILPNTHCVSSNVQPHVFEEQCLSGSLAASAPPKSIISVAKRQEAPKENTLKAGPWTTVSHKKRLLSSHSSAGPGFLVHEDNFDESLVGLPANLPLECLEDYSNWHVAIVNYPDEASPSVTHGYPKHRVYIDPQTEFSIEELRATRYRKSIGAVQHVETCQAVQSILIDDDEDDDLIVLDLPHLESEEVKPNFDIQPSSPVNDPSHSFNNEVTSTVRHSPWKSQAEHQNFLKDVFSKSNEFRISGAVPPTKCMEFEDPQPQAPKNCFRLSFSPEERSGRGIFVNYEGSPEIPPQAPPKGNAMRTAFRVLNADEVETGSRGGMDGAMAAQPADGARPMVHLPFSDSSSSSCDDNDVPGFNPLELSCTTQQFNFNLNAMQVSTPQNKIHISEVSNEQDLHSTKKRLFSDNKLHEDKALSTILEEKSGCISSSSSSGAATKSSIYSQQIKMSTISEEHNSYLEQNLKANAALRRSLLGNLMDDLEDVLPTQVICTPHSPMQSTPIESPVRKIPPPNLTRPLEYIPSDPFNPNLISRLLERVSFPGIHHQGLLQIDGNPKLSIRKDPIYIGSDSYIIEKLLGKGQFGTVFKAQNLHMRTTVALKHQKPPNKWEYYICRELQARLASHSLRDRFMDISIGYFSDQASILVSQYQPFGSLLDTANLLKTLDRQTTGKESICIYFTLEMLKIVKAMHEVKIIHADIKPDNFLVIMTADNSLSLQLIDFGCSIDMTLFPENATFTRPITTDNFVCCEVQERRPWSYHTDLFCVAASAHVLLFQEYIELKKTGDVWSILKHFPRYIKIDLWNMFFSTLLNQQAGPANTDSLELLFQEELELNPRRDVNIHLRKLINMLKNR